MKMNRLEADSLLSSRFRGTHSALRGQPISEMVNNNMPPFGTTGSNVAAYRFASPYNYAPIPALSSGGSSRQPYSHRAHSDIVTRTARPAYDSGVRLELEDNWGDNATAITGATSETGGGSVLNEEQFIAGIPTHVAIAGGFTRPKESSDGCDCAHILSVGASSVLGLLALASPVVMLILPRCNLGGWTAGANCGVRCEAPLVSLSGKLLILLLGSWALFVRPSRCSLPRLRLYRALVAGLLLVLLTVFWLYYAFRMLEKREEDYASIVAFCSSFVDTLLLVHYLALLLMELRMLDSRFAVKVVRSPDGAAHTYAIGALSIQHAAVHVLDRYCVDFEQHNTLVDAAIRRHATLNAGGRRSAARAARKAQSTSRSGAVEYKFYEIDGVSHANGGNVPSSEQNPGNTSEPASFLPAHSLQNPAMSLSNGRKPSSQNPDGLPSRAMSDIAYPTTNANGSCAGAGANGAIVAENGGSPLGGRYRRRMDRDVMRNDRFYAELEYERRLRRRRARLISSVDDAFARLRKISAEHGVMAAPMEPSEAAQAVFASIARPLQKYLRVTRQQLKHSMETIVAHLALCLTYELGPRVFLERFLAEGAVLQQAAGSALRQTWTVLTDACVLNRAVDDGTVFILKRLDVTLLCTVHKLPFFTLSEEILDVKSNKFVLKLNSETSV